MKNKFQKMTVKDIAFIAILSAVLLLISSILMPIAHTKQFGFRQMIASPIFALFVVIGLLKVPKIGTLTLIGIFSGAVLLFMSPIMFWNNFLGALLSELLVLLVFRSYKTPKAIFMAASLFMPLAIPVSLCITSFIRGESIAALWGTGHRSVLICLGAVLLGAAGSAIGFKIGKELKRAGKIL